MKLSSIEQGFVNVSGNIYDSDFINLAVINNNSISLDERTRFLSQDVKDKLNSQPINRYDDAVYIVKRGASYSLICDIDLDDYRQGNLIAHELVIPDVIQGMISNIQSYNAETAPVFLIAPEPIDFEVYINELEHEVLHVEDMTFYIFKKENARTVLDGFALIDSLLIGDGHHRLYSNSIWHRKKTILSCIMGIDDIGIKSIHRCIPKVSDEVFAKATHFIKNQFNVSSENLPLSKGYIHIRRGEEQMTVKLIDLESNDFWNNDVYRLNTQVLSQAFGIYDTSILEYYIELSDDVIRKGDLNHDVFIEFAPICKEEVLFVAENKAIMPPKSTAFSPKFPSFLIFKVYQ